MNEPSLDADSGSWVQHGQTLRRLLVEPVAAARGKHETLAKNQRALKQRKELPLNKVGDVRFKRNYVQISILFTFS